MAQTEDAVVEQLTDMAGEDTDLMGEDMMYHLQRLRRHPLNINSASRSAMEETMLFTPFQIESILGRIASSGPILSFAELSLLYGFDVKTVERIRPYVVLGEAVRRPDKFLKDESTSIYSRYQRVLDPAGEQHLLRVRSSYLDRVDFSAVIKGFSTQRQLDNNATVGLAYSGLKLGAIRVDKIVLGDFYARMGQGLAVWNGFSFTGAAEGSGFARNSEPVSLYTSSDTVRLLRGGAFSVSWKKVRLSLGHSLKGAASVAGMTVTGRRTRYGVTYIRKENVGSVLSADVISAPAGAVVFAEAAWSPETESFAGLAGASLEMEKNTLHFLVRGYGKDFSSPFGGAYSSLSKTSNQQGVSLRMTGELYRKTNYSVGVDYSAYPAPRYRVKDPSSTFKGYVKLSWDDSSFGSAADNELWVKGYIKKDVRYSSPREREQNISLKTGGKFLLLSGVSLLLRGELNTLGGRAFSSCLKLDKRASGCTVGVAMFHVRDWAARIYFPEAELPYSFSSHLMYGQGMDFFCLARIRPSRWLSLYLKYQYRRGVSTAKAAVRLEL